MFESIPSFEIGYGFAVELFIIVFSFLCWLFSVDTPLVSASKEEAVSTVPDGLRAEKECSGDFGEHCPGSLGAAIEGLTLNEVRTVTSRLKELNIINPDIKLSGKGIGKDFLIGLVRDKASDYHETIASALSDALGKTIT
jgi:hypothetical protein